MAPNRQTGKRPTLKDVAVAAGVSLSTASLVFSGKGPVSPETGAKVRAAADALGYAGPDPLAASLRQGRSGTVAVIVEGSLADAFADPFAVRVMDGLASALDEIPAGLLLLSRQSSAHDRLLAQLSSAAIDAVVMPLCGPVTDPVVEPMVARGIPMIGSGAPDDPRVNQIKVDERGAMSTMARHVADLGHTRVAHVTMNLTNDAVTRRIPASAVSAATYPDARDRALGLLDVFPDADLVEAGWADLAHGEEAARLLLDVDPTQRPTAIVAQSDLLAAGVVRVAAELGLSVPGDLSVTGFDGLDLPWLDVHLTTVVQDGQTKGRALGAMVAAALQGRATTSREFPVTVRLGDTTTAPADW